MTTECPHVTWVGTSPDGPTSSWRCDACGADMGELQNWEDADFSAWKRLNGSNPNDDVDVRGRFGTRPLR